MAEGITLGRKARRDAMHEADTAGYRWADLPGDLMRIFGTAGRAGIDGMATALSGVDEQGRSVGSILPFAKDERTGDVGLASPRILDLWNTAGGVVPAKGITLGAGPVMRAADDALDMSQEARMARAREMGFDVENPVYHGTAADPKWSTFDELTKAIDDYSSFDEFRGATFVAKNPKYASGFAQEQANIRAYGNTASVMPLYVRNGKYFDTTADLEFWKKLKKDPEKIKDSLQKQGYDGIRLRETDRDDLSGDVLLVFDPKNIRSVHAAFDPAKRDSADLLASRAAPGSLGIGGDRRLTYRDIEDWL